MVVVTVCGTLEGYTKEILKQDLKELFLVEAGINLSKAFDDIDKEVALPRFLATSSISSLL